MVDAVSGASRYTYSASLANEKGLPPSIPLSISGGSAQGFLDAAQARGSVRGIGLSSSARSLNSQFLNNTGSQGTALFGLSSGASQSISDVAQKIKALRSSLPRSQISPAVLKAEEEKAAKDAKAAAEALQKEAENLVKNKRGVSIKEYETLLAEQVRILQNKQADANKPAHTSFRRGVSLDEQA